MVKRARLCRPFPVMGGWVGAARCEGLPQAFFSVSTGEGEGEGEGRYYFDAPPL